MNIRIFASKFGLVLFALMATLACSPEPNGLVTTRERDYLSSKPLVQSVKAANGITSPFTPTLPFVSEGFPRTNKEISKLNDKIVFLINNDAFLPSVKMQRDLSFAILVDKKHRLDDTLSRISKQNGFLSLLHVRASIFQRGHIRFDTNELQNLHIYFEGRLTAQQIDSFENESPRIRAALLSFTLGHYWYYRLEIEIAMKFFEDASNLGFRSEECDWYLAQTYLLAGDKGRATTICNKLIHSKDPFMVQKAIQLQWSALHGSKSQ